MTDQLKLTLSSAKLSDLHLSILYPFDGHYSTDSLQDVGTEQRKLNYICENKYIVDSVSDLTMSKSMGPSNTCSPSPVAYQILHATFRCSCTLSI